MSAGQFPDGPPEGQAPVGQVDHLRPLTNELIGAVLDARGYHYAVDDDGDVGGTWDDHLVYFFRLGQDQDVLQIRITASRQFTVDDVARLYAFANEWNRERLWPKAYVHVSDTGGAVVCGETLVHLAAGVSFNQLDQFVGCGLASGLQMARAVTEL